MASTTSDGYPFITKGTADSSSMVAASVLIANGAQDVLDNFIEPGLIPRVADAAARSARYPIPVQGDRVFRNDVGYTETYFDVVSVSNIGGRPTAGWYRTGDYISSAVGVAGFTPAAGWTLSQIRYKISAGWVYANTVLVRTGGTITVPADGNITDVSVGTIGGELTDYLPPTSIALSTGTAGPSRLAAGTLISSGAMTLTAVSPGASIVNTDVITLAGVWPYL